jgi:hypothetical protein
MALALVALPFASHPRGQSPATPSAAFVITKIPSIVRQVIPADFTGDGRIDLVATSSWTDAGVRSAPRPNGGGDGPSDRRATADADAGTCHRAPA